MSRRTPTRTVADAEITPDRRGIAANKRLAPEGTTPVPGGPLPSTPVLAGLLGYVSDATSWSSLSEQQQTCTLDACRSLLAHRGQPALQAWALSPFLHNLYLARPRVQVGPVECQVMEASVGAHNVMHLLLSDGACTAWAKCPPCHGPTVRSSVDNVTVASVVIRRDVVSDGEDFCFRTNKYVDAGSKRIQLHVVDYHDVRHLYNDPHVQVGSPARATVGDYGINGGLAAGSDVRRIGAGTVVARAVSSDDGGAGSGSGPGVGAGSGPGPGGGDESSSDDSDNSDVVPDRPPGCTGRCGFVLLHRGRDGDDAYVGATVDIGDECLLLLFPLPPLGVIARNCPFTDRAVGDMTRTQCRNLIFWYYAKQVWCTPFHPSICFYTHVT